MSCDNERREEEKKKHEELHIQQVSLCNLHSISSFRRTKEESLASLNSVCKYFFSKSIRIPNYFLYENEKCLQPELL